MNRDGDNVCIIDDDDAMRDSLTEFFLAKGFRVTAFGSAEAFLESDSHRTAGCAIVDLNLPKMSGLELQALLRRQGSTLPIIVLTGQGDIPKAVAAIKAGAVDFFEKPFNPTAALAAVRDALQRKTWPRKSASEIEDTRRRIESLSAREREVLDLITMGHPSKIIADKLGISIRTVDVHRSNIMEKMHCTNSTALVSIVLRAGGLKP